MIKLDIENVLNPNNIDLSEVDWDVVAAENIQLTDTSNLETSAENTQGAFPEGFDIPVKEISEISVPDTGYSTSSCKIYYPEGDGPFPIVFYIHGGAFFGGWQFLDEPACRQICHDVGCAVISPLYVLAPQFKFPAAIIELYKTLRYFVRNADKFHLDASKVVIAGNSAGGNYAMAVCQVVHEQKQFDLEFGVFYYPVLDMRIPVSDRYDEQTDRITMPPELMEKMYEIYLPDGVDRADPLVSPLLMELDALPPFIMFSGRRDSFNYEGRAFAERCAREGKNEAIFKWYPNCGHGFMESDINVPAARDSKAIVCDILKRVFNS